MSQHGYSSESLYRLAVQIRNTASAILSVERLARKDRRQPTKAEEEQLNRVATRGYNINRDTESGANRRLAKALDADLESLKANPDASLAQEILNKVAAIGSQRKKLPAVPIYAIGVYEVVQHVVTHFDMTPRTACRHLIKHGLPFDNDIEEELKSVLQVRWNQLLGDSVNGSGSRKTGKGGERKDPDAGREKWLLQKYIRSSF